jgi:hypothetical protein
VDLRYWADVGSVDDVEGIDDIVEARVMLPKSTNIIAHLSQRCSGSSFWALRAKPLAQHGYYPPHAVG